MLVSESYLDLVTHTTFQELLLTPFNVHEILGFETLSSVKYFCHREISEILFRVRGLDPWFVRINLNPNVNRDPENLSTLLWFTHELACGFTHELTQRPV